jgi:hypothetical protein
LTVADRLFRELDGWSKRTEFRREEELVFAHPQTGSQIPRSAAHVRYTAGRLRSADADDPGAPRAVDSRTTQIYTHYVPSEHEVQIVNEAFAPKAQKKPEKAAGGEGEELVPASEEDHVEE